MSFFNKIFGDSSEEKTDKLAWKVLQTQEELDAIIARSTEVPCAIFKHSTRCSISSMAKGRLERQWDLTDEQVEVYYLDLIAFRPVSNRIAEVLEVEHQSPQLILLKEGKAVFDTSHNAISVDALKANL